MKYRLFDTNINIRFEHCVKNNSGNAYKVEEPYVNIYVRLRNRCNAKCKFCEFTNDSEAFSLERFDIALTEITNGLKIQKVSFTGGEPTLDIELLKAAIRQVRRIEEETPAFIVVNTNGVNLNRLSGLDIDSIAMSRHHYLDEKNNEILGFKAPSKDQIRNFPNQNLHLSCNLMKGYIDSSEEAIKYLEFCSDVGVDDVGFVSLMKVNDFCRDNHVDFNELDFSGYRNILRTATWNNRDCCRCANYIYASPENANIVKMYSRYYYKPHDSEGMLVFDGINLREGFNGKIIF